MEARLAITWELSSIHGWGVFGLNLMHELLAHADNAGDNASDKNGPRPLLLHDTNLDLIDPVHHAMLQPFIDEQRRLRESAAHIESVGLHDTLVLHSSGNNLLRNEVSKRYSGSRNIGFTFFEETAIPNDAIADAKAFDAMRTGSNWNRDYLLSRGIANVVCVHQGVDTESFRPRPKSGRFKDRFVIFSGGKLEYRKGQDIVLAAFKVFQQRHPDALLLTVWQNPWPDSMASIQLSPHVRSAPKFDPSPADAIMAWTAAEGVRKGAHIDVGVIGNATLPDLLRDADVAVFANRCEGGTNLAAMECMASGIPCVMSMNTGHMDIANKDNCSPLTQQAKISDTHGRYDAWGESDIDEIVAALDAIYHDREQAKARAENAVNTMREMTWTTQIEKLITSFG